MAVVWKDKSDVSADSHDPPTEGNYHDEAIKPAIVVDYNRHLGHVDNADTVANR
jgi:hypothetical protein